MEGKGGALAPPLQGPLIVPLPRLPRSLRPQAAREASEKQEGRPRLRRG
jgi:hypothetical protein